MNNNDVISRTRETLKRVTEWPSTIAYPDTPLFNVEIAIDLITELVNELEDSRNKVGIR